MTGRSREPAEPGAPAVRGRDLSATERALLTLGADPAFVDAVLGDLAEESAARAARDGVGAARRWYAREALHAAPHLVRHALWRVVRRGSARQRAALAAAGAGVCLTASAAALAWLTRVGPAVRLTAGPTETVIINGRHPTPLAVRALDAAGRTVAGAPVRYAWAGGDALPVTPGGDVTCTRSGDLVVRAVSGRVAARLRVQCRVVEYVSIPGPLQFVLGDSALSRPVPLPVVTYGADARPIAPAVAGVSVRDTDIATLRGLILAPRRRGITLASASVGDRAGRIGVHVYQRVDTLAALDTLLRVPPGQRLFAVPLRLARGEFRRQRLPPGTWMLTLVPEADTAADRVRLQIDGATCQAHLLNTPRRWGCLAGPGATVTVYRALVPGAAPPTTGYLLVRWLFS